MADSADQMTAAAAAAALLKELEDAATGINATKYLSVASFVVLIYDHFLLLDEEIQLVWKSRWSYIKILFIFNRYLVPACLFLSNMELSGLNSFEFTNFFCKFWLATSGFLAVVSLGMANAFIVYRLYLLWNRDKTVLKVLITAFIITYLFTLGMMGMAAHQFVPLVTWSPILKTCIISQKPMLIVAVWAAPILFDCFIFVMTCWNALSRPRDLHTAVTKSLYRDGIAFFVTLTAFRIFNVTVVAAAPLPLLQLGAFTVWAFMTCAINRLLIQHRAKHGAQVIVSYGDPNFAGDEPPENMYTSYIEMDKKPPRLPSRVV